MTRRSLRTALTHHICTGVVPLCIHLKRFSEALDDVRSSLKIQRNNEQALLLRGILYEELGSVRRARRSFQRVINITTASENRKKEASAGLKRIAART